MGRFAATFGVDAAPAAVVSYLSDYAHTVEWDPGTVRCPRVGDGPVAVGARWENVSEFRGAEAVLTYTLVELDGSRVRFEGEGRGATTVDDFTVSPAAGGGSTIAYTAVISLRTWRKAADPFLRGLYRRMGIGAVDGLTAALAAAT